MKNPIKHAQAMKAREMEAERQANPRYKLYRNKGERDIHRQELKQLIAEKKADAILAASSRKASAGAKKRNPRLKRIR